MELKTAENFVDETVYPVSQSRMADNAFYHPCDAVGGRPSYAICVNKLHAFDEGRDDWLPECVSAIRRGTCAALAMREQEKTAGKALFYINREKLRLHIGEPEHVRMGPSLQARRPMFTPSAIPLVRSGATHAPHVPSTTRVQPRVEESFDSSNDFANAINAAVRDEVKQQVVKPTPAPEPVAVEVDEEPVTAAVVVKSGMSPAEIARARIAAQQ